MPRLWWEADVNPDTVYDYSFSVWPDPRSSRWSRAACLLVNIIDGRQMKEFTERQFNDFREKLAKMGLELRNIERAPHHEFFPVH